MELEKNEEKFEMNWTIFTVEEKERILDLVNKGAWDHIASCMLIQDPAQEYWLERFIDEHKPTGINLDSKVKKELETALTNDPTNMLIDSPEKEAEWQKKIDEEQKAHEEIVKVKKAKKIKKSK